MIRFIHMFDEFLESLSRWGIVLGLFLILALSVLSIFLRWFGESFMWMEPLVRHLVFLIAFLGGSLATSKNVHIRVDVFSKLVESTNSKIFRWVHQNLISLFCLITCLFLLKSSYDFFLVEKEYGGAAFLDIHSSWLVGIIPFGMGLIALRFFNQLVIGIFNGGNSEHTGL